MWPVVVQALLALVGVALVWREVWADDTSGMSVVGLCLFTGFWALWSVRAWRKRFTRVGD